MPQSVADLPETVSLKGTFGELWSVARDAVVGFVRYPGSLVFVETDDGRIGEVVG